MIYLDHNATTPVLPEVLEAMLPYLRDQFGNPSSDHAVGRRSRDAVESAREQVAASLSARPDEVLFTSGGTESNNLAIRGVAAVAAADRRRVVTSCVEHPATLGPCEHLEKMGWALTLLPVAKSGHVDAGEVRRAMGSDVALVSLMLAQNETGAPHARRRSRRRGPCGGCAGAYRRGAGGRQDRRRRRCPRGRLLSVAGHKCYAPKGVGALYLRRGTPR